MSTNCPESVKFVLDVIHIIHRIKFEIQFFGIIMYLCNTILGLCKVRVHTFKIRAITVCIDVIEMYVTLLFMCKYREFRIICLLLVRMVRNSRDSL